MKILDLHDLGSKRPDTDAEKMIQIDRGGGVNGLHEASGHGPWLARQDEPLPLRLAQEWRFAVGAEGPFQVVLYFDGGAEIDRHVRLMEQKAPLRLELLQRL